MADVTTAATRDRVCADGRCGACWACRRAAGEPRPTTVVEAAGTRFELVQLDRRGRWAELRHPGCGKAVTFVRPAGDRVDWYTGSHRCRPGDWQGYR